MQEVAPEALRDSDRGAHALPVQGCAGRRSDRFERPRATRTRGLARWPGRFRPSHPCRASALHATRVSVGARDARCGREGGRPIHRATADLPTRLSTDIVRGENRRKHRLIVQSGARLRNRRSQVRILSGALPRNPATAGFSSAPPASRRTGRWNLLAYPQSRTPGGRRAHGDRLLDLRGRLRGNERE